MAFFLGRQYGKYQTKQHLKKQKETNEIIQNQIEQIISREKNKTVDSINNSKQNISQTSLNGNSQEKQFSNQTKSTNSNLQQSTINSSFDQKNHLNQNDIKELNESIQSEQSKKKSSLQLLSDSEQNSLKKQSSSYDNSSSKNITQKNSQSQNLCQEMNQYQQNNCKQQKEFSNQQDVQNNEFLENQKLFQEKLFQEKIQLKGNLQEQRSKAKFQMEIHQQGDKVIKKEFHIIESEYQGSNIDDYVDCIQKNGGIVIDQDQTSKTKRLLFNVVGEKDDYNIEGNVKLIKNNSQLKKALQSQNLQIDQHFQDNQLMPYFNSQKIFDGSQSVKQNFEKYHSNQQLQMENHFPKSINQEELFETGRFQRIFEQAKEIGKGGFGRVYEAVHRIEKKKYAIKQVYMSMSPEDHIQDQKVFREVSYLTQFNHRNVLRFYTTWIEKPSEQFHLEYLRQKNKFIRNQNKFKQRINPVQKNLKETIPSYVSNQGISHESQFQHEIPSVDLKETNLSDIGFEWERPSNFKDESCSSEEEESSFQTDQIEFWKDQTENKTQSEQLQNSKQQLLIKQMISNKKSNEIPVILNIQMHLCQGETLQTYLEKRKINKEVSFYKENFDFFNQLVEGLNYIHSNGIIHRDIKPANIFLDKDKTLIIGDFGLAAILNQNIQDSEQINFISSKSKSHQLKQDIWTAELNKKSLCLTKRVGTPMYLAPEMEIGLNYDFKVDIYALGLILFEMTCKMRTAHEKITLFNDLKQHQQLPEVIDSDNKEVGQLIKRLTQNQQDLRPKIQDIYNLQEYKAWQQSIQQLEQINYTH